MPRATLKVKSNPGLVALSNAHPEIRFEVLGAWPSEEHFRLLVETTEGDLEAIEAALTGIPPIRDYEIRHAASERILFEVSTPVPEPHGAMAESGVVPSFPQHVENGWLTGDVIASREQISAFRDELVEAEIEHEVVHVSSIDDEPNLLTDRQADVIELAVERGYYDSPRGCTLRDIATDLDVDKSVVSRILQRAEGRIIKSYHPAGDSRTQR